MAKMKKVKSASVRLYNCSKQMLPIQVRPPGSDFFSSEQQIRIEPGQDVVLPKSHVNNDQIQNLSKRRMLKVTYDSDS